MPVDKFGRMSDAKTRDTGVSLTYINNNYRLLILIIIIFVAMVVLPFPVLHVINMNCNTLYNVSDPVNPQDVATKEYADKVGGGETAIIKTRYRNYGAIGNIDMRGYTLTNVLDPADAQDVATEQYVDEIDRAFVYGEGKNLAAGEVSMGGRRLNNVGMPIENHQASNKFYVDKNVDTSRIIAIHSNYCGLLRKGEYQFVFGGNITQPSGGACGFLMPHSGRIKKIKVKISHDEGIENLRNFDLVPWCDFSCSIEPIFTFTLIKEEKNLTDFLSYSCFKFNSLSPYYFDRNNPMYAGFTDEEIKIRNEEIDKGITFLDKYGDKITLIEEDIACTFFPIPFTSVEDFTQPKSILNFPISRGDILNIRTEKENASVWGRDISFTYLFTFLIELDPL